MLRQFIRAISTSIVSQQRGGPTSLFASLTDSQQISESDIDWALWTRRETISQLVQTWISMKIWRVIFQRFINRTKSTKRELIKRNELLKRRIVSQKYFDDYSPNFLTWSEKEHIRHLHKTSPQEWTPERLANSFPVNEAGARKIIKVVWKPATQSRINRHDASAIRNWKELKEGTIEDMTPELKAHVKKFTKRVIPPRSDAVTKESIMMEMNMKRTVGEFGSIVAGHRESSNTDNEENRLSDEKSTKYLSNDFTQKNQDDPETEKSSDLIVSGGTTDISGREKQLFPRLRSNLMNNSADISLLDKLIISPLNVDDSSKDHSKTKMDTVPPVNQMKTHMQSVENYQPEETVVRVFVEKINIPSKAWKKGRTYKVDDCYYDDDGEFLYRVPGMTNAAS